MQQKKPQVIKPQPVSFGEERYHQEFNKLRSTNEMMAVELDHLRKEMTLIDDDMGADPKLEFELGEARQSIQDL